MKDIRLLAPILISIVLLISIFGCGNPTGGGGGGGPSGSTNPADHISTVDASAGKTSALVLDNTGNPNIIYYKAMPLGTFESHVVRWTGTAWEDEVLWPGESCGAGLCYFYDASESTHHEFYSWYQPNGVYGYHKEWNSSGWGRGGGLIDPETVLTGTYGGMSCAARLTATASITAYTAFYDYDSNELSVYTEITTWDAYHEWGYSNTTVVDSASDVGKFNSIAINLQGSPEISYYDATSLDLKYAKWNGSAWGTETIDSVNNVGQWSDLDFDSKGNAWVCFYDATNDKLKIASHEGSGWDKRDVTLASGGGQGASIKLDSQDRPCISFMGSSGGLKLAKWNGSTWDISTIDPDPPADLCSSLALDSNDKVRISYYNSKGGAKELRYYWE